MWNRSSKISGGQEVTSQVLQFELTPSLRYVAPGQSARFFVGGAAGIGTWRANGDGTGLDTESRERVITVGPVLGVHGFLTDHVSLDPALELKMVSISQGVEGSDDRWSGVGVRVGVTLSLTGWLGTAKSKVPARETEGQGAASPAYTPRAAPPPVAATVHFDGFSMYLRGMPEKRGDALGVEVRRLTPTPEWEACPLVLTAEDGTQIAVQVTHDIDYAGKGRKEEHLGGWVSYGELAHWAEHTPGFSLCGRPYALGPQDVMNVGLTLRQFKGRAVRAGTFKESVPAVLAPPPAAPAVEPQPSTSAPMDPNSAPATAPEDANPDSAAAAPPPAP